MSKEICDLSALLDLLDEKIARNHNLQDVLANEIGQVSLARIVEILLIEGMENVPSSYVSIDGEMVDEKYPTERMVRSSMQMDLSGCSLRGTNEPPGSISRKW
eukprot:CAMPEP_0184491992 /NCGR_PEP_ID=MMETSP0113_2-20130426/21984_1 /TAXON_ID=91329 /ORGANISM="Norrisiella sphaerica, Strain BC52" /LENGTH=102 /DNA_ID=CAMNT_0026876591 /DNA_START=98 /DNA_END=403 /DNA_ORIENTATION=+